jgi:hypothetical protein
MLDFKVYERESTLTDAGSVASIVGKDGEIHLIPKNFADKDKRVVLLLKKADGTSATVTCSESVSNKLRAREIGIAHVAQMKVLVGELGAFVSESGNTIAFAVKDLKPVKAKASVTDALIAELANAGI